MIQTIIICVTIIAIVTLICHTSYKIHTYKSTDITLKEIYRELDWIKSNYSLNSDTLDKVWDNIQEIKQHLIKVTDELNNQKTS